MGAGKTSFTVNGFTYYSTTQGNPENQRLSVEMCMKKAEPFLLMGDPASVVDLLRFAGRIGSGQGSGSLTLF